MAAEPRSHILERDESELEFSRVVAFSDGVFAIAITLLVLALEIPPNLDDLSAALRARESEFVAYGISFAVLGSIWLSHHRFYASVARFDSRLIVLNLIYLGFVALVPFTSELLGHYADETQAVVIYAVNLAATSLLFTAQVRYAYRNDLVNEKARAYRRRFTGPAAYVVSATFIASIPVAFIAPPVSFHLDRPAARRRTDRRRNRRSEVAVLAS